MFLQLLLSNFCDVAGCSDHGVGMGGLMSLEYVHNVGGEGYVVKLQ